MPTTTISERLKALIITLGENQNSFSKKIGFGAPTTAKILQGKNNPGYDYLCAILTTYPEVSAKWLMLGEGRMVEKQSPIR